jgi:Iap family predicted aminopeptidase
MEISRILSDQKQPPFEMKIPVVLIPYYPADKPVWLDGDWTFLELEEHIEQIQSLGVEKPVFSEKTGFLKDVTLDLEIEYDFQEIQTSNVLGFLPGRDPEVVVLGAHYDHLGVNPRGDIFYGADDNASGIAALLEIAKALSARKSELQRSVLFIAFGAEEWGLLGSQFYVEHPVIPNEYVVAMLNLDSIGKGKPKEIHLVGSSVYPELASMSRKYMAQLGLVEGSNIDKFAFNSGTDHYPFHLKGIPALEYFSSNYRELHTLQDTVDRVQPDKVAQVAQVVYLTAFELLTAPRLPFLKD